MEARAYNVQHNGQLCTSINNEIVVVWRRDHLSTRLYSVITL